MHTLFSAICQLYPFLRDKHNYICFYIHIHDKQIRIETLQLSLLLIIIVIIIIIVAIIIIQTYGRHLLL